MCLHPSFSSPSPWLVFVSIHDDAWCTNSRKPRACCLLQPRESQDDRAQGGEHCGGHTEGGAWAPSVTEEGRAGSRRPWRGLCREMEGVCSRVGVSEAAPLPDLPRFAPFDPSMTALRRSVHGVGCPGDRYLSVYDDTAAMEPLHEASAGYEAPLSVTSMADVFVKAEGFVFNRKVTGPAAALPWTVVVRKHSLVYPGMPHDLF